MRGFMKHSLWVLCFWWLSAAQSWAVECGALDTAEVLRAEDMRLAAQMQNDLQTMDRLLDEELVYVRNSAVVDSKRSYLESMRRGDTVYEKIDHINDGVRIYGCLAILTGLGHYVVQIQQKPLDLNLRYHSVWRRKNGQLTFVSWQATRVPETHPVNACELKRKACLDKEFGNPMRELNYCEKVFKNCEAMTDAPSKR